jgi:hypothetical protein
MNVEGFSRIGQTAQDLNGKMFRSGMEVEGNLCPSGRGFRPAELEILSGLRENSLP